MFDHIDLVRLGFHRMPNTDWYRYFLSGTEYIDLNVVENYLQINPEPFYSRPFFIKVKSLSQIKKVIALNGGKND